MEKIPASFTPEQKNVAQQILKERGLSIAGVMEDLQSMKVMLCGGEHERVDVSVPEVGYCRKRGINLACLHPMDNIRGYASAVRRMHDYFVAAQAIQKATKIPFDVEEKSGIRFLDMDDDNDDWLDPPPKPKTLAKVFDDAKYTLNDLDKKAVATYRRGESYRGKRISLPTFEEGKNVIAGDQHDAAQPLLEIQDRLLDLYGKLQ